LRAFVESRFTSFSSRVSESGAAFVAFADFAAAGLAVDFAGAFAGAAVAAVSVAGAGAGFAAAAAGAGSC
jgi:hypothetical protein